MNNKGGPKRAANGRKKERGGRVKGAKSPETLARWQEELVEGVSSMTTWKSAVTASLALLGSFLTASSSFAASQLADCSRWNAASLADYACAADLRFNRDRQGEPFLLG